MSLNPQNKPYRAPDPFKDVVPPTVPSLQYKQGDLIKINEHMLGYLCRPDKHSDDQRFNSLLILGGSEGGISERTVEFWAKQGYLALGVAYHRGLPRWGPFEWDKIPSELAQGIPEHLAQIELLRFEDAVKILQKDPSSTGDLATIGASRGGELALILGALYPQIRAVAALVPSAAVVLAHSWDNAIYPKFQANKTPAWQCNGIAYHGDPTDETFCSEDTLGRIPVEDITGALFLISGGKDRVWHQRFVEECPHIVNAEQIALRRNNPGDVAVHYQEAGHYFPLPNRVADLTEDHIREFGGKSLEVVGQASIDAHNRLTEFLNRHLPSGPQTL